MLPMILVTAVSAGVLSVMFLMALSDRFTFPRQVLSGDFTQWAFASLYTLAVLIGTGSTWKQYPVALAALYVVLLVWKVLEGIVAVIESYLTGRRRR